MARIFLSHSSADEREAVAINKWLTENGWDDVFLDIDPQRGLSAGDRWQDALRQAADRCEAVVFIVSPAWAKSKWCLAEFLLAKSLHKRVFGVVLKDVPLGELPTEMTSEWQLCQLIGSGPSEIIAFRHRDTDDSMAFLAEGLGRLKAGLKKAGLSADFFPWPPPDEPDRSPFRGLEPLDFEDAAVFFGRDLEILRGLDVLRGLRDNPATRLFVILAASGTGKSSFLRAGLLPRLARDDRHFLPLGVVRPETTPISGDRGLAQSLARSMKKLGLSGSNPGDLKMQLSAGASEFASILRNIQEAARARLVRSGDESPSSAPTLVLPVDQAEELFNADAGPEARKFLSLIAGIVRDAQNPTRASSPAVSLIVAFTIRSDRYELQTDPELAGLKTTVFDDLKPMSATRFREVITGPVQRASTAAGRLEIKPDLVDRLVEDCATGADTLPLLSLTLERLYHDFGSDGDLRLDEYIALGGLGNIINEKIQKVLDADPEKRKLQLALLRAAFVAGLVTINPQNNEPMRKVARRADLPPESLPLLDALADQRLLTRDRRHGEAVIEVAHEALLRQWDELARWLRDERAALKEADALERQSREWKERGSDESWLWGGQRLKDASALAARTEFGEKLKGCAEFLECSRKQQEKRDSENARVQAEKLKAAEELAAAQQKLAAEQVTAREQAEKAAARSSRLSKFAAAVSVLAAVGAVAAWLFYGRANRARIAATESAKQATHQKEQAKAATTRAETALNESRRQFDRSSLEEGKAWLESARLALEKKDPLTAIMLAGRSLGFEGYGREEASGTWKEKFPPLLGREMTADPGAETERRAVQAEAEEFIDGIHPTLLPIWSSPLRANHLRKVTSVAFSPDGTRIVSGSADRKLKLWDAVTGQQMGSLSSNADLVSSVAFSPDGRLLASGGGQTVELWDVATGNEVITLSDPGGIVKAVAFSPNGSQIAGGLTDGAVKLWDVATGKEVATLSGHQESVNSVAFHPDGTRLATGSEDETVKIWSASTRKEVATLSAHTESITSVAFSLDGTRLASGSADHTLKLWDVASGREVATLDGDGLSVEQLALIKLLGAAIRNQAGVNTVAFSPDGTRLASGSANRKIKIWDAASGQELAALTGHAESITSVAFSPDGKRVASGSNDNTVRVWDAAAGRPATTPPGHQANVTTVAFSPDGTLVASGSADRTVKLWNAATGQEMASLTGHTKNITSVEFSPDATLVASGSKDSSVKLWDAITGKELATFTGHEGSVDSVAFSPDGTRLASGADDGTVKLWNPAARTEVTTLRSEDESGITSVAFSPDSTQLVTGSDDNLVKIWDLATGKAETTVTDHAGRVTSVCFSPDGTYVLSGSEDNTLKLWDAATGDEVSTLAGHEDSVTSVSFSPDGTRLLSSSDDGTVKLWDATTRKELASVTGHHGGVTSVCFSPDATKVATGSDDHTVKLWDAAIARDGCLVLRPEVRVSDVAFSPDETRFAIGFADGKVSLWDVATGRKLATLPGHAAGISSIVFGADSTRLASGSEDNTVKVWDTATGLEVATFSGHTANVTCVAFSPDATRLASGSYDETAKLWDIATGRPIATFGQQKDGVTSVSFSADGTLLTTEAEDGTVKIWDANTGQEVADKLGSSASSIGPKTRREERLIAESPLTLIRLGSAQPMAPDLVHFQDEGLLHLKGREVVWATNLSLFTALTVTAQHYRQDELAALAAPQIPPATADALRLQLMVHASQWRAARAWWTRAGNARAEALRRPYLTLLLTSAADSLATVVPSSVAELTAEISANLTPETAGDVRVSLPLAQHLLLRASSPEKCPPPIWNAFVAKVGQTTTRRWQEGVASQAGAIHRDHDFPAEARQRLDAMIRSFAIAHPDSARLLRAHIVIRDGASKERLADEDRLLGMPEAVAQDFIDAAYAAARRQRVTRTKALLQLAEARFPANELVSRMTGWSLINLGDGPGALAAFHRTRSMLKGEEQPDTNLLAGLSLAQWLNNDGRTAVETYRQLIETGLASDPPVAWADPKTIAGPDWPEAEAKPMEDLRAATLAEYPELKSQ